MGGLGSGRRAAFHKRKTIGDYYSIDVNEWNRKGLLSGDTTFQWGVGWWRRLRAALHVERTGNTLRLTHSWLKGKTPFSKVLGDDHAPVNEIALDWSSCHYGGQRPWFICPSCHGRAGKLYIAPHKNASWITRRTRCRKCRDLAYATQGMNVEERAVKKARRIRGRLGGVFAMPLLQPFPRKPKGMHWRTYERLAVEALEAELVWMKAMEKDNERVRRAFSRRFGM